jgi:hypothetical protein
MVAMPRCCDQQAATAFARFLPFMNMSAETDFRKWFVDILDPLRPKGEAGFIFAMVTFPLLERYLRNESRCPEGENLTDDFFTKLGTHFPGIPSGKEREFWNCYRDGLLHQVTFPSAKRDKTQKKGIWINLPPAAISGHDKRPIYFDQQNGGFFLNPLAFYDYVVKELVLRHFNVYEGNTTYNQPPRVYNPQTVQPGVTPTTGIPLSTGSYQPPSKGNP